MSETPLFDRFTDNEMPLFDRFSFIPQDTFALDSQAPLQAGIVSPDITAFAESTGITTTPEKPDNFFDRLAKREAVSAGQSLATLASGVAAAERGIVDQLDALTKVLEEKFGIPRGGAFEIASNFLKENEAYFEERGIDPTQGTMASVAHAISKGMGRLAVDLPIISQTGLAQYTTLTGAGQALVEGDDVLMGATEGLAQGLLLHGSLRGISQLSMGARGAAGGTIFGLPSVVQQLQLPEDQRDYSQVAADIMIGIGLSLPGGINSKRDKAVKSELTTEITKRTAKGKPAKEAIAEVAIMTDKAVGGLKGEVEFFDAEGKTLVKNIKDLAKEVNVPKPSAQKATPVVEVDAAAPGETPATGKVAVANVEGINAKTPPDLPPAESIPSIQQPTNVKQWPTRVKDLARVHIKQKSVGEEGQDFTDLKIATTGKASMGEMTKAEIAKYETELDRQSGISKGNSTAETSTIPESIRETTITEKVKNKIVKSPAGVNFGSGVAVIENLGKPGKKLSGLIYDTYVRRQSIRGDGDQVIKQINDLLSKKEARGLSAAVDPLFRELASPEYLSDPRVITAQRIWKDYTDRLHEQRVRYNTWVMVDGKRVPADMVYHESWLRRQLSEEARKELGNNQGSEVYNREVERLIKNGKAKNNEEAEMLIGEWLRKSPMYNGPIRYGSADRPRLEDLSPEMYERDFSKLAPGIIDRYSRFLAAAESFGQDMKVRDKLVGRIAITQGGDMGKFTNDLLRDFLEGEPSSGTRRFLQAINSGISQGQLSFPTSGTNNILYSNNTDLPILGVRAWVGGYLGWVDGPFQYRKGIELARKAGQIETGTRELEAAGLRGAVSKFSPGLMRPTEFFNRMKATISFRIAGTQAAKALHGSLPERLTRIAGGRRPIQSARQFLKNFGKFSEPEIDAIGERGYLTEKEMFRVMALGPTLTQGSANPVFMPKVARGELGAPLATLKKMAFRATAGMYTGVVRPALQGNIGPVIKWAAATTAAGESMYYINYMLFGWTHPEEGSPLLDRLARDAMRGNGLGIIQDWFDGYGMMPVAIDKSIDVWNDLESLVAGTQTVGQTLDDTAESLLGAYRGVKRVYRANLHESAPEIRNWQAARSFVRKFNEDAGKKSQKIDSSFLTERSPFYREIRESFWNGDPNAKGEQKIQQDKEWNLTLWAAAEAIATQYEASGLRRATARKKARDNIKGVIGRLAPVLLSEAKQKQFFATLDEGQLEIVRQSQKEYRLRRAKKGLRFGKPSEVTAY